LHSRIDLTVRLWDWDIVHEILTLRYRNSIAMR
jgi:hypothetical protein